MRDWGTRDLPGVIDWAAERYPKARLVALGHSFGGMSFGLAPNGSRLSRLLALASQHGYHGHWPPVQRLRYFALWHLVMPGLTRSIGYFPGRRLGLGEDLPRGVALEWARWCRRRDYVGEWAGHARLAVPLLAMSFTDDSYAPVPAAAALVAKYAAAEREHRVVAPADQGVARIGHFGFFREGLAPALWQEAVDWLLERG